MNTLNTQALAVSLKTAAQMISVSRRTLEHYIRARRLPSLKIGRRTLIRMRDLEAFLREDQPAPRSPQTQNSNSEVVMTV